MIHSSINPAPVPKKKLYKQEPGIVKSVQLPQRPLFFAIKRVADIIGSILFIVLILSWLVPFIALLVKLDSPGPVFFVQRRMGKKGKYFSCLKFRTMYVNEEADEKQAGDNDERITRTGYHLRRLNIDELPQFLNVLAGQMSLIGPRPHMQTDCIRFSFVIRNYSFRNAVRPGITGLAQVKGYHGPTPDYDSIYNRFYWDSEYIQRASAKLDMLILFQTIKGVLENMFFRSTNRSAKKISSLPRRPQEEL